MKYLSHKKGVSPLIATVLLIAFSVALGAVVMNWGRSFVSERTEKVESDTEVQLQCSVDIVLEFVEINNIKQVCDYGDGSFRIIVQNLGSVNATGVSVRAIDENSDVFTFQNISSDLGAGEAKKYIFSDTGMANVTHIAVSPMIRYPSSSNLQTCSGNSIEISQIEDC